MTSTPEPFVHLLAAWNERDLTKIRALCQKGVTADVEFTDPNYAIKGIDAFVAMVKEFRERLPNAMVTRTSGIDTHHDRARYSWTVTAGPLKVDGFDAVALAPSGLVKRIDGFFGPLPAP